MLTHGCTQVPCPICNSGLERWIHEVQNIFHYPIAQKLSDEEVDRIARRVAEILKEDK